MFTYITGDYTKLCLNIICNRSFFLFWNDVSFVPVRVLHKDEKILGWKHIYLPHAQTAIYDSKVKLFLKQEISRQLQWWSTIPPIWTQQRKFKQSGVSKWVGTRYFYPSEIVDSTDIVYINNTFLTKKFPVITSLYTFRKRKCNHPRGTECLPF
jgi:hypothetical protein